MIPWKRVHTLKKRSCRGFFSIQTCIPFIHCQTRAVRFAYSCSTTSTLCGKCRAKLELGKLVMVSSAPSILMPTAQVILHNHKPSKKTSQTPSHALTDSLAFNQTVVPPLTAQLAFLAKVRLGHNAKDAKDLCRYLELLPDKVKAFSSLQ